ncbi:hypothetical protein [Priestia megaterium]|uniref:hypothetical protein n=1 Tax=Priestia megaterium TaxID=1404 RepID=UPI002E21B0DB|nr:hypothetical protein [Priestia megaterium]
MRILFFGAMWAFVLAFVAGVVGLVVYEVKAFHNENEYTLTVTDKTVKTDSESSTYLIFTKDSDGHVKTLKNVDSLFKGKHNSSDIYADLEVGKTYKFNVFGYRIPFLSAYENIETYKEVDR